MRRLTALAAIGLSGCAHLPVPGPSPGVEVIRYDLRPGFMVGRAYQFTAASIGEGQLTLEFRARGGWRTIHRRLHFSPAQFEAFRNQLAAYRPVGRLELASLEACHEYDDDSDTAMIEWSGGSVPPSQLFYSFGCDIHAQRRRDSDLRSAPERLGFVPDKLIEAARRD